MRSLSRALAAVLVASAHASADPGPVPPADGAPCGLRVGDWCPAPADDPCGRHSDEKSCRADPRCHGLPYRGESVEPCMPDGHGFSSNCPAVGCLSRSDPAGKPPRAEVVKRLCSSRSGGEGAEIRVWRTDRNEVTVLELRESVKRHPNATVTYHDVGGNQELSIPTSPAAPGSDLERSFARMREAILANLRAAETIRCVP